MAPASSQDAAAVFDPLRQRLVRVAYRMLGSVADAEDVLQDAFLRWLDVDRNAVREPEAFLRRVVTRLCLDRLKSVRCGRETYVGPWLPEPVVETAEDEIDDVTLPLLMALERLSPLERAAFLLHDVFGLGFEEVAATIGREPAPTRKAPAAGLNDVMRLFAGFASVYAVSRSRLVRYGFINGLPGFITIERGDILQTTALEIEHEGIVAIYVVRNPDNSGTWLTPCIDDLGRASGFTLRLRSNEWGLPIHRPMNRIYEYAPEVTRSAVFQGRQGLTVRIDTETQETTQ